MERLQAGNDPIEQTVTVSPSGYGLTVTVTS